MNSIEFGYEQIRFEEKERDLLKTIVRDIDDLDLINIQDPGLQESLLVRLAYNTLMWLPKDVHVFEICEGIEAYREVPENEQIKLWDLDDVKDYIKEHEAPPYPGPSHYTPPGL